MPDRLQAFLSSPLGARVAELLPVSTPPTLRRHAPGQPLAEGPVLVVGAAGGQLRGPAADVLAAAGAEVLEALPDEPTDEPAGEPGDGARIRVAAVVADLTGVERSDDLGAIHDLLHPVLRRVRRSGRVVVLGRPPEEADDPRARAARRALEGAVRSLGKEVRDGATANLVHVAAGAEGDLAGVLRFLVSARSAYVSGQVLRLGPAPAVGSGEGGTGELDVDRPLADRVAVVTGASRGIGAAIARVLARDGAHVVCLDVPSQGDALQRVANEVGGTTLQLDVTADDAPERFVAHLTERHGRVDLVVHNAGITRDRTLANMDRAWWDAVLAVNLTAPERLDAALLASDVLADDGRIVCVSSMAGIAGGKGQVNYAASKAGVIGHVDALAADLAARGGAINAVAPGFIETDMTGAMPLVPREFGRRLNSLSQGGLPVDVAEAIAWLGSPAARGVNGLTLRVDGQHLIGA